MRKLHNEGLLLIMDNCRGPESDLNFPGALVELLPPR